MSVVVFYGTLRLFTISFSCMWGLCFAGGRSLWVIIALNLWILNTSVCFNWQNCYESKAKWNWAKAVAPMPIRYSNNKMRARNYMGALTTLCVNINNLPKRVSSTVRLFADDCLLYQGDTKPFWKYVRAQRQDNVGVAPLLDNGVLYTDSLSKACVVSAVLRVVLGGNGNLMVQIDFIILNSRPRMHVQNQRT